MEIKFKIQGQQLFRVDMNEIVELSQNYLTASFETDSDWSKLAITALFQKGTVIREVILQNNSCNIPIEVIRAGGFAVSLLGIEGNKVVTSNKVIVYVGQTIDSSKATSPAEPTKSLYAQLLDRISRLEAEGVDPEVIAQAIENYFANNPIEEGISEAECNALIESYYLSHKAELIEEVVNSISNAEDVSL